jgi:hypothetical protein
MHQDQALPKQQQRPHRMPTAMPCAARARAPARGMEMVHSLQIGILRPVCASRGFRSTQRDAAATLEETAMEEKAIS